MKKHLLLVVIFIASFIAFALYQLPAAVAVQLVEGQLPKNIRLGTVTGSVWQGKISEVRVDNVQVMNVRWDLSGAALFMGSLQGQLQWGSPRNTTQMSGKSDFSVSLLSQQAELSSTVMRFNVEHLITQLNLPLPVQAKGRIIFNVDNYVTGQPYCQQLAGEVFSPDISVEGFSGWFSIGELAGELQCKSGDVAVVVQPDNLLGLQADVLLADNFKFTVAGNMKPDPSLPKDVHDAVKFLPPPDSQGRYPVNL